MHSNAVIASLSPADTAALRPHLRTIELRQKTILWEAGDSIDAVYFPTRAVISLVVGLSTGEMVEAAMVGRDGVVGASSSGDQKTSINRAVVQFGGEALVCPPEVLKKVLQQSAALLSAIASHEHALFAQAQQSTACMAAHDIQSRLSRWLLRVRDLSGTDSVLVTQEFLAEMLGVRRTSVTVAAFSLQQAGLIKYARGKIQIINVDGLKDVSCECYEALKLNYGRLTGVGTAPKVRFRT